MMGDEVMMIEGLWSAAQAAREIVAGGAQDEPFYVCDLRELAARHARWRRLMPRVEPFYAVKCNDDKMLLRTLAALGTGFDCASRGEIELVTGLGVAPDRIIYANTLKSPSHIRYAASVGVDLVTFDSEAELIKMKQLMPHAQLVIRIRCDSTAARLYFGERFGCDPTTEAPALLKLADALGLNVVGVSFHVGYQSEEPEAYARAIRGCRAVFQSAAEMGNTLRLVDIGGGFHGKSGTCIKEVSVVINAELEKHFPDPGVRIIAEPGYYYAAAAYTLAAMVHAKKEVPATNGSEMHTMYCINNGIFGDFLRKLYTGEQNVPTPLYPSDAKLQPCSIWGQTCSPSDCVVSSTSLPPLEVGSWLLFHDMGGYTRCSTTTFNGFPAARVITFVDRTLWSMLKKQWPLLECQLPPRGDPCGGAGGEPCSRSARAGENTLPDTMNKANSLELSLG